MLNARQYRGQRQQVCSASVRFTRRGIPSWGFGDVGDLNAGNRGDPWDTVVSVFDEDRAGRGVGLIVGSGTQLENLLSRPEERWRVRTVSSVSDTLVP